MDEVVLMNFIQNFPPINIFKVETKDQIDNYKISNKKIYWLFVEQVRKNIELYNEKGASPSYYILGLIEKINDHINYLFIREDNLVFSTFDKSIIVYPVQEDNLLSEYCNWQYSYLEKAVRYLQTQLSYESINPSPEKKPITEAFSKRPSNKAYGFKIKNPTNLYSAWKSLRKDENNFISKEVKFDPFERNFTGKAITKRITWIKSENCLHYFIDGLAGNHHALGTGIEKEKDIWIKAALVFENKYQDFFDSENLSHASRLPTTDQMGKLNLIITQLNRQPKERLT